MSTSSERKLANLRRGNPGNQSKRTVRAFKELCRDSLDRIGALQVVERVIVGDIAEQIGTTKTGEPIYGETKNADRLQAVKFLASYAHGMPTQKVEDVTKSPVRPPIDLVAAIPGLLGILQIPHQEKAKLLQAISIDVEVVE